MNYRETAGQMLRKVTAEGSDLRRHLYHSIQGSRDTVEGGRKVTEDGWKGCELLFFEHDMATALVNSFLFVC